MDSDQNGNGPKQCEIELLYDEALTAFADCTGLKAKRDEAVKNAIAKTKLLHEIVGPDNWEPLLKRRKSGGSAKPRGRSSRGSNTEWGSRATRADGYPVAPAHCRRPSSTTS